MTSWSSLTKISGSRSASGSGFICQRNKPDLTWYHLQEHELCRLASPPWSAGCSRISGPAPRHPVTSLPSSLPPLLETPHFRSSCRTEQNLAWHFWKRKLAFESYFKTLWSPKKGLNSKKVGTLIKANQMWIVVTLFKTTCRIKSTSWKLQPGFGIQDRQP